VMLEQVTADVEPTGAKVTGPTLGFERLVVFISWEGGPQVRGLRCHREKMT